MCFGKLTFGLHKRLRRVLRRVLFLRGPGQKWPTTGCRALLWGPSEVAQFSVVFLFVSASRLFMGRNRKFVLEDDLQQAVWRAILRGPRPPSAKWGRDDARNSKAGPKQAQPCIEKKFEVKAPKQFGQTSTTPRVSLSRKPRSRRKNVPRLTALQEKEQSMPSLFTVPDPRCQRVFKPNSVGCRVSSMVSRRNCLRFGVATQ